MLTNQEIFDQIELYADLLELQGENVFKVRSYHTAVFNLEKLDKNLADLPLAEIEKLSGVGKAIALKIDEARNVGMFHQLKEQLEKIPAGVVDMLSISGLGAKKVGVLWQELKLEDTDQLLQACENNQIAQVKGFGEKTQENIKQALLFKQANSDKMHFAKAEQYATQLENYLKTNLQNTDFQLVGQMRRKLEIVDEIQFVIQSNEVDWIFSILDQADFLQKNEKNASLFAWRGSFKGNKLKVEIQVAKSENYFGEIFIQSASRQHLGFVPQGNAKSFLQLAQNQSFSSEAEIYQKVNWAYIEPEMREGGFELELAQKNELPKLLEISDIRGIIHAHSTYSDGKHSLEQMATACRDLGYEYLGITDHSQSAFYANGLNEYRIKQQHQEIDQLNQKFAPFRIFKGIEADILNDGKLDYEDRILASFDFIIASVHSVLKMTEEKATERIIKAIENQYTTILGHPTGRLLLRREGYPLNHAKIIEACAQNGVVIEINASPWRLDLDWRWVHYALEKGVMLSINPDSHEMGTIPEVKYGVYVGRKGGLTKDNTLNTKGLAEIEGYFKNKKR
ncbi:MAG: PHP domain-containing protein [Microscillaceae bacterium]|jgi:DNA polymerase (family 10)|nr:PHP domain-containing protein [Microscillaceae bacterium]